MVDSRSKGQRAEYQIRDKMRAHTGLQWERVPGSGGFSAVHALKGDIYIPDVDIKHCIEIKHYKDDTVNSLLLKNMDGQLGKFWAQTCREAAQIKKEPLLIFKKDRGQWLVATEKAADVVPELMYTSEFREDKFKEAEFGSFYIYLFETWLNTSKKEDFLK